MNEKEQEEYAKEQRKMGIKLAKEAGAEKTIEAIKNTEICYDAILRTAANEIGTDKLVSVLKQNNPFLAQNAIKHLDLTDDHTDSLAATATVNLGEASSVNLHLIAGIAYTGWMTMFWRNPGEIYTLPNAATPDKNKWHWSPQMSASVNNTYGSDCSKYAIKDAPIKPGATCWMVIDIQTGGRWELTQYTFTYNPDVNKSLQVESWGAIHTPKFSGKLE